MYETQLKTHQMKASKMEAALANQTYQVSIFRLSRNFDRRLFPLDQIRPVSFLIPCSLQVQSEKRKLEQEVVNLNERTRLQEEENVRLKSEVSFLRLVILVG